MDFKKKLKQRLYLAVAYLVLGLILLVTGITTGTDNYFFTAFGFAMLLMGILRLVQYRKITRDERTVRKQELTETDERNRMIAERARSWAFSFSILIAGVAVIVLSVMGYHEEALPFAWFVCGMTILYWISWAIIQKKY